MGEAGRARAAREFGLERMTRETEALYRELL
jgi:glycosyltransferase involved in cell wall biosynthesis